MARAGSLVPLAGFRRNGGRALASRPRPRVEAHRQEGAAVPEKEIDIRYEPERNRFVLSVGGVDVGFVQYGLDRDGTWVFDEAFVDPSYEGRGLGSQVVDAALQHAREHNQPFRATCPFVVARLGRRPKA